MSKQRLEFIQNLFEYIEHKEYLLLKFTENSLSEINEHSDLDIFISKKEWEVVESFATNNSTVTDVKAHRQSSMSQLFLFFEDGGFLQIDGLFQLIRKDLIYLSPTELLKNQVIKSGIKTYSDFNLFQHLVLFSQLNFAGLPDKYVAHFEKMDSATVAKILDEFNQKYNCHFKSVKSFAKFDTELRNKIVKQIKTLTENDWVARQKNNFAYFLDSIKKLKTQRGFLISFTGVDGAGKSTILEETRKILAKKFRKKTVVIRHRPSLLPILSSYKYGKAGAEKRAATRLPRQGNNQSQFKSLLRFFYYFTDYIIGRSYIFFNYQLRNYIVLYDRYYFDFIVDMKRTNLKMNSAIPKSLYRFVQKPKLNFFLYAPAEIILARKKELSPEAITALTNNYKNLFEELEKKYPQSYHSIRNIHMEETLNHISKQIKFNL